MADANQSSSSSNQQAIRFDGVTKQVVVRPNTGDENDFDCVFLDDVHDFFPNVTGFTCHDQQVNFLFDRDGNRLRPYRIQAVPSQVLEAHEPIPSLQIASDDASDGQLMELSQKLDEIEYRSDDRYQQLNGAMEQMRADLVRQGVELAEYCVPRLFIVVKDDSDHSDPKNLSKNHFRLHFLCECASESIHLAHHEGYTITRPDEFFDQYGPYLRAMISLVEGNLAIGGMVAPSLVAMIPQIRLPNALVKVDE